MALRTTLDDLIGRCPHQFDLLGIAEKAKPLVGESHGPYVLVAQQEMGRMNVLLGEIALSLSDLKKGLNGQLNMSQPMEDLAEALTLLQVPGRNPFHSCSWERSAWPSTKGLGSWFNDMMRRNTELRKWSETLVLPFSLWLPGLFNPTAFLTAVKQVTARARGLPLDKMGVETHVTRMIEASEADTRGGYPDDGAFIHGLFIEGARWLSGEDAEDDQYTISGVDCEGSLGVSKLKELIPQMPVMYVKAVQVMEDWTPSAVGYLRPEPEIYNCPLYTTQMRGPTFTAVCSLKTKDLNSKWILGGVALMMQTSL